MAEATSRDGLPIRDGDVVYLLHDRQAPPAVEQATVIRVAHRTDPPGVMVQVGEAGLLYLAGEVFRDPLHAQRALATVLHERERLLWQQWHDTHAALTACHWQLATSPMEAMR